MLLRALVAGAFCAGLLSACAVIDPVDSRYDTVGRSLAKGRDESIFLNLVRASHDYPLAFTAISNVTPTMTNTSSFALPSFSIGPANCLRQAVATTSFPTTCSYGTGALGAATGFGNTTASNSTAISTNFSVSTQETGNFYEGFLKPIDLQILDYFIRQNYPRELLFWLFADSFQVGPPGFGALGYDFNPPVSYGCPASDPAKLCFREWVWVAVLAGLTVEEKTIVKPAAGAGESQKPKSGTGSTKGPTTTIVARFCFSPQLARQARLQMGPEKADRIVSTFVPGGLAGLHAVSPICGQWSDADAKLKSTQPQSDTFDFYVGPKRFRVISRSAYGVFEFLGNLMRIQRDNVPPTNDANTPQRPDYFGQEATVPPQLLTTLTDTKLISVLQNGGSERCFSHTWFYDGDYCVPESATNTKRIFSLLSQLIAIETTASDLSITPIVRVIE
jgi:hypothetical protein